MKRQETKWSEYHNWKRWLFVDWHPKMPKDLTREMALLIADVIAWHGDAGKGCYPSSQRVADIVGRSRDTVGKYRRFLIDQGVFAKNGKRHRRAEELDIAKGGQPTGHIKTPDLRKCEACREFYREGGNATEMRYLHMEATGEEWI